MAYGWVYLFAAMVEFHKPETSIAFVVPVEHVVGLESQMAKPIITVPDDIDIRYAARLIYRPDLSFIIDS